MSLSNESDRAADLDWKLKPVLRAIELVEEHIHKPIRVGDMADAAGYSVFHFCRCFNELTGHSPYDYQMKRKLSCALKELQAGGRSITSIALDFGFDTPEGFSRAFKKMFGILPSAVGGDDDPDSRLSLPPLTEKYLHDLNRHFGRPVMVESESIELQGTADYHLSAAEALARLQPTDGVAVVDFHPGWEVKGMRLFWEMQIQHQLYTCIESGEYTVFPLNIPVTAVDSFLLFLFSGFCRRAGGAQFLPDRIVFDIHGGVVKKARFKKSPEL